MSHRTRVKKLEEHSNNQFVVAWKKYVARDCTPIKWSSEMDEDAVYAIEVSGLIIERHKGETFNELDKRATREANEKLNVTIWLHPSVIGV